MSTYRNEFDLTAGGSDAYPTAAQVDLREAFVPDEWGFNNLSAGSIFYVSFDGVNDHVKLELGVPSQSMKIRTKARRAWLRRDAVAPPAPCLLEVVAHTHA